VKKERNALKIKFYGNKTIQYVPKLYNISTLALYSPRWHTTYVYRVALLSAHARIVYA